MSQAAAYSGSLPPGKTEEDVDELLVRHNGDLILERFWSLLGCISDMHSSKTKIVVRALAIYVCSLFAAGAAQTATARTMPITTARGGLEVGAIWTPAPESILR
jgi:hypothetical protein